METRRHRFSNSLLQLDYKAMVPSTETTAHFNTSEHHNRQLNKALCSHLTLWIYSSRFRQCLPTATTFDI